MVAADSSFLFSFYGEDVNTPEARSWIKEHAQPVFVTDALRFETENAFRLSYFRGKLTRGDLEKALADIETGFLVDALVTCDISAADHWAECRRLSEIYMESLGCRAFDITHVAGALLLEAKTFLSFDKKQRALATSVGLAVAP